MSGLPSRTAPGERCSVTRLLTKIVPERNRPLGKTTLPPPLAAAASTAAWIVDVSRVTPSPFAPKSRTLNKVSAKGTSR